jgi:hypothetical protein
MPCIQNFMHCSLYLVPYQWQNLMHSSSVPSTVFCLLSEICNLTVQSVKSLYINQIHVEVNNTVQDYAVFSEG